MVQQSREERLEKMLRELLRLYDWRFSLAERENDPRDARDKVFQAETRRLLRQYGTEKKAAWDAARAMLSETVTMKKIFKTTYKVVVLTEDAPVNPDLDLEDVIRDFTDGESIGEVEQEGSEEVPLNKVREELVKIGNDGSFFDMYLDDGDKEKKPPESELARLFKVANDEEANVIEAAAIKAGLIWRCSDTDCRYNNDESDTKCGGCGKAR